MTSLSDSELMARLKEAAPEVVAAGFAVLVHRHQSAILSFLTRYVGDARTAEDLAQEAFLRVYRKIDDYASTAKFSTWLYTIALNLARDEFKRRARHPAASLDLKMGAEFGPTGLSLVASGMDSAPEAALERAETRDRVALALARLKAGDREILILKDVQGLPYEEIARILKLPMGTVKSRISRARLAFKEVWKEWSSGEDRL
ncbi:MAG: sigma-70 family RNA polymerase sigma factor [Planctomycetes bacterium]|nr:sigma-70 family RNA polymerase sigma factor [Planctomycetota bacterium]